MLFEAYRNAQFHGNFGGNIEYHEEWTCDQFWETGGAVNNHASVMLQFTWDASYPDHAVNLWNQCYRSIRNCNLVLELIDGSTLPDDEKTRIKSEARFIRAIVYYKLYMRSGGVPLRLKSEGVIKVGAATEVEMKDKKLRIEDALNATKAAVQEGVVAGGGTAPINAIPAVRALCDTLEGDERTGAKIVLKALEAPLRQIAKNAGLEGSVIIDKIISANKPNYGFDAQNEVFVEDMIAAGIVDPTKVTRSALENAASVAEMVLTTESLVADLPEPPAPAAPAGGDMGGMY